MPTPIIGLIAKEKHGYSRRRWIAEAKKRNVEMVFFNPEETTVALEDEQRLLVNGQVFERSLQGIARILVYSQTAIMIEQFFIDQGARNLWIDVERAVRCANSKVQMYNSLSQKHIKVPRWYIISHEKMIPTCLQFFHRGFPFVVKPDIQHSERGKGVFLAEDQKQFEAMVQQSLADGREVIVQEFVAEESGRDYRAVVLDDTIIGAAMRDNTGVDFRSNQGRVYAVDLTKRQKELAITAAKAVGARYAGVDMLGTPDDPVVTEVNSPCDYRYVEENTDANIVGALMDDLLS